MYSSSRRGRPWSLPAQDNAVVFSILIIIIFLLLYSYSWDVTLTARFSYPLPLSQQLLPLRHHWFGAEGLRPPLPLGDVVGPPRGAG